VAANYNTIALHRNGDLCLTGDSDSSKAAVRLGKTLIAVILCLLSAGCGKRSPAETATDPYLYEDTRQLVELVESAADLIEQRGPEAAFREFDRPDSRWRNSSTYLFVYDANGTCVWHGLDPELVGRNLISLRDPLGKPVVQSIVDVAGRPEPDASDWMFYLWEERNDFHPDWKSSYIRKVVAPDKKVYLVGSGSHRIKVEKVFAERQVDAAARVIQQKGTEAAFHELVDPASQFNYLGSFVFVLDDRGRALVDPSYPTLQGRDMSNFRDAVGRLVVQELLQKLQTSDTAWLQFLWPKPGERLPSRKLIYARKVNVNGQTLIVGSDFYLLTPIWMKL
jgi:signal transduction histidine kinase